MKINERKMRKIKEFLQDVIDNIEITDVNVIPVGYRDYEIESFAVSLDADDLVERIKRILEQEE